MLKQDNAECINSICSRWSYVFSKVRATSENFKIRKTGFQLKANLPDKMYVDLWFVFLITQ